MENTIIGILLGSTVMSAMVTSIFNVIIRKKDTSLVHITTEREKWREKIRKIAEDIEKTEFQENNISQFLVQLEVNINPYGKENKSEFERDSHVWIEIENIKEAKSKEEFNKHKELLIYYLSLMLKEDWERSKQEVKGYSRTLIEVVSMLMINCIIGGYYTYKLEGTYGFFDILAFAVIATIVIYIFLRYFQQIGVENLIVNNRIRKSYYLEVFAYFGLMIIMTAIIALLMVGLLNVYCLELMALNWFSCFVCFVECMFVCYNWMNNNLKKALLARTVIDVKEKTLNDSKQKLFEYEKNVNELWNYIEQNYEDLDAIKQSSISLRKTIKWYRMELRDRKDRLKRGKMTSEENIECIKIQNKLQDLEEMKDKVEQFSTEGIINKIGHWIRRIFNWKRIVRWFKKITRIFWNVPGKSSTFSQIKKSRE